MKIYVLVMEQGEYSDYSMHILDAFASKEAAENEANSLRLKKNSDDYWWSDRTYSVYDLELREASKLPFIDIMSIPVEEFTKDGLVEILRDHTDRDVYIRDGMVVRSKGRQIKYAIEGTLGDLIDAIKKG